MSRVDRVISTVYPLYRHNTKDKSLGVGRDIKYIRRVTGTVYE